MPFRVQVYDVETELANLSEFPMSGGTGLRDLIWSRDGKYLAATADFDPAGKGKDPRCYRVGEHGSPRDWIKKSPTRIEFGQPALNVAVAGA